MNTMSRRQMLRVAGASTGAVGAAAAMASCGSADEEASSTQLSIAWWGNDTRNRAMEDALEQYQQQNEAFNASMQPAPWAGYWDRISTQLAGREGVDWIMMDQGYLAEFADRGALADLEPYLDTVIDLSNVSMDLVESGRINGELYVIPLATNTQMVLMNQSLLNELELSVDQGEYSWSDLADLARAVGDATDGEVKGFENAGGDLDFFEVWLRSRGQELYHPTEAELGFSVDEVLEWFEFWQELQMDGAVLTPDVQAAADAGAGGDDPIIARETAMIFDWSPQWANFQGLTTDELVGTLTPSGPSGSGQFVKAANYFCAASTSENIEEAAALTNFLLNDRNAAASLGMTLGVPVSADSQEVVSDQVDRADQGTLDFVAAADAVSRPQERPWLQGHSNINQALLRVYEDVAFDRMPMDDAAAQFISEAESSI